MTDIEKLKYPVGKHVNPDVITATMREAYIQTLSAFPANLKEVILDYTPLQLDTPYRPGGWTVRQVVHHCADSHINAFTRFKLALTEVKPVVKPYMEALWAELADAKELPVEPSLMILEGLHCRWTVLLKSLSEEQYKRSFIHPEHNKEFKLDECLALYAWHCRHHLAHATLVSMK